MATTEEKVAKVKKTWSDNFPGNVRIAVTMPKEGARVFEKKGSEKPK